MKLIKLSVGAFQLTESLRKSTFNFNRFLNVARWNFTINRSQYTKLALSLFLVMSLPLLTFILKTIWMSAVTGNMELALASSIPGTNMGTWMSACFIVAWPILSGYTFHNLLTKQSRIKELTLPASNGEKFLFHALVTIGGSLLVYVVSYFLLDILQYLYVGIFYGFSNTHWISYSSILFMHEGDGMWVLLIMDLMYVAFSSTFVLGNALKYRHNVLWTCLFHFVLSFALLFAVGLTIPFLGDWMTDVSNWMTDWLQADYNFLIWKTLLTVFFLAVIVFCWWAAYRLYTRAQITTLRNK